MSKGKLPPTDNNSGDIYLTHSGQPQHDEKSLLESLSGDDFAYWYQRRQFRENIRNGQAYFNSMDHVPESIRHNPSSLLQCHRKITYRQLNAPEERADTHGIFWVGTKFEEELALPFLQEVVTTENTFVTNSLWVDYTRENHSEEIQIKGSTDPVLVDGEGTPILPTEIKTKSSVEDLDEPNRHHRAQLHAYIVGLNEKYDTDLSEGVLIYASRKTLDVAVFHVEFDPKFWEETVLRWADDHTQYRLNETLPPADPEYDWECTFCDYRHRCGQSGRDYNDRGPQGLLSGFKEYPREKVIQYLEAHPDQSLTPTLAQEYPDLVEIYDVPNWYCKTCDSHIDGRTVADADDPLCPLCADRGDLSSLSLPEQEGWDPSPHSNSERTQT